MRTSYKRRNIHPTIVIKRQPAHGTATPLHSTQTPESVAEEVKREIDEQLLAGSSKTTDYEGLGSDLWQALERGDINRIVELYNVALAILPYDTSKKQKEYHNEHWYRSMFIMFLRGAGILPYAEVRTFKGNCDLVVQVKNMVIVLEFKFATTTSQVENKMQEAKYQMMVEKEYAKGYEADHWQVICAVIIADDEKKQAIVQIINPNQEVNHE